jgi:hypothetical protein
VIRQGLESQLDGNFGVTSTKLLSAVDEGHSYCDAESIVDAATLSGGGVAATTFAAVFLPGQKFTLKGKLPTDVCSCDYLRSELQEDELLWIFQLSGYGLGKRIDPDLSLIQVHNEDNDNVGRSPFFFLLLDKVNSVMVP